MSQILYSLPCSLNRYFVTSGEAASSGPILEHVTAEALSVTTIKGEKKNEGILIKGIKLLR